MFFLHNKTRFIILVKSMQNDLEEPLTLYLGYFFANFCIVLIEHVAKNMGLISRRNNY